jgi:alkylation response protein AidB-like acyl-CoA dehydrogenase
VHVPFTVLRGRELDLQAEVRAFLQAELPHGSFEPNLGMEGEEDRAFSRKLGERGWLGMALPPEYGGGGRTLVERFVVTEELLRWGAPVASHWVADRQSGPVINRFGTEAQKRRFLPPVCRGELSFSIGMSEPDAGSDLASVRTRATKVDSGWVVNGTKIWTSGAHEHDWLILLCRTSDSDERHRGLSQLLVDLRSPGLEVNPVRFIDGTAHFNEVVLTDVFVPDDLLLGEEGQGWAQNTSELGYERGGPERWLSPWLVLEGFLREEGGRLDDEGLALLGDLVARYWTVRHLSLAVARMLDDGRSPAVESALAKSIGTRLEQDVVDVVQRLLGVEPSLDSPSPLERLLARCVLVAPSWTIRGGTTEILRTVISKGLDR